MSLKSKAKADKRRQHLKNQRLLEEQKLAKNAHRLKTMTTSFSRSEISNEERQNFAKQKFPKLRVDDAEVSHVKDRWTMAKSNRRVETDEEMIERDMRARQEYERKKQRTGPLYNKGGYQYFGELDLAELQKGGLRRRS